MLVTYVNEEEVDADQAEGLGGCLVDTTITDCQQQKSVEDNLVEPEDASDPADPNKRILRTRRRKINYAC